MDNQTQEVELTWQEREATRMAALETRKAEILADEGLMQRVCSAYVGRNVIHCASYLMSGIAKLMWERNFREAFDEDGDSLRGLFERRDYEVAVDEYIDDADLDDLKAIAEMVGDWSEVVDSIVPPEEVREDDNWADFFDANPDKLDVIRTAVKALISGDEYEEIANHFDLDPEYIEVYEHWIVDDYFAQELKEHDQVVGEFAGFTIWGRCTTGQAISLDWVIRQIVKEKDADHWIWAEA